MPVITCVKRPIPVPMCGPWDGSDASAAEIRAFVGRNAPGGRPAFRVRPISGVEVGQVYDRKHASWISFPRGSYIAEGDEGENYPIAGDVWARTYDEVPESDTAGEPTGLDALIEALAIFRRYGNPSSPTFCDHDVLYVCVDYSTVNDEDKKRLDRLGFFHNKAGDGFMSYDFGSA